MTATEERFVKQFEKEFQLAKDDIKRPNILLLGGTGVGKSSLINSIVGKNVAQVNHTKPETRGFKKYEDPEIPITIIDSEGYELSDSISFVDTVKKFIDDNYSTPKSQIHICWYCISAPSGRFLDYDAEVIELLRKKKIPTAIVFTKCDCDSIDDPNTLKIAASIKAKVGKTENFETTSDEEFVKEFDNEKLVEWSINNISDENLRLGFVAAQTLLLDEKNKMADKQIGIYTSLATGVGASPLPFTDVPILMGLQVKLAAAIYSVYGIEHTYKSLVKNFLRVNMVSIIGQALAFGILKLIPGVNLAAYAVTGGVAGSLTFAFGKAIKSLCRSAYEAAIKGNTSEISNIFTAENLESEFTKNYKKKTL